MILQENAYLEVYYGIFRDILYFDDIQTVKICFGVAFDLHFDFTFSKKYKNKEEAFAEIECYLRQDKVFNLNRKRYKMGNRQYACKDTVAENTHREPLRRKSAESHNRKMVADRT